MQIKSKIVSCHIADFNPVKQEVSGILILPPLVFPAYSQQRSPKSFVFFIRTRRVMMGMLFWLKVNWNKKREENLPALMRDKQTKLKVKKK